MKWVSFQTINLKSIRKFRIDQSKLNFKEIWQLLPLSLLSLLLLINDK